MDRCRLLLLPPELRNRIYTHILVDSKPIELSSRPTHIATAAQGVTLHYTHLLEPPFLRTSRQIRHEALPIFYGDNVFFTAITDALAPWLRAIGPVKTGLIRHIRGFQPSRYFKYEWARNLAGAVERELARKGCVGLAKGVFRMPFGCEGLEGSVFWVSTVGDRVLASREGCVEHAVEAFRVLVDADGFVRLVPVRSCNGGIGGVDGAGRSDIHGSENGQGREGCSAVVLCHEETLEATTF